MSPSPRPTLEQVMALLKFMEEHPNLAVGKMKGGVEARAESKKLWLKLSRVLNSMSGPKKPIKSWIKFWSDKKSNVKTKVQTAGGDASTLLSNVESRIWDLFLSNQCKKTVSKKKDKNIKEEPQYGEHLFEASVEDEDHVDNDAEYEEQPAAEDIEDRHLNIMEQLVRVMGEQASAMSRLADASAFNSQSMARLAEASELQARAIERLARSMEEIGASSLDMRSAILDMDVTLKRLYQAPT